MHVDKWHLNYTEISGRLPGGDDAWAEIFEGGMEANE